jgi:hypothetical protein
MVDFHHWSEGSEFLVVETNPDGLQVKVDFLFLGKKVCLLVQNLENVVLVFPQHKEQIVSNEFDPQNGVPGLENRFEDELFLNWRVLAQETLPNHQLVSVSNQFVLPSSLCYHFSGVRVVAYNLSWVLAEMGNLGFKRLQVSWVCHLIQINAVFVGQRIEDVHTLNGVLPSLLVAIDNVDPLMEIRRDITAL